MTSQEFCELFGEKPEDVLGEDWENTTDYYLAEDMFYAQRAEGDKRTVLEQGLI